jgi:hypothetical protein
MEHGLLDAEGRLEEYVRDAFESLPPELRVAFRSLNCSKGLPPQERLIARGGGVDGWQERAELIMRSPQAHHA